MKIALFGDSHSRYFFCKPYQLGRIGRLNQRYVISGESVKSASLAGFRPQQSTLDTKARVLNGSVDADVLCLCFGQVDLELGYYYRNVVKKDKVNKEEYIDWIIKIYMDFIISLPFDVSKVVVKGVNLTALTGKTFTLKYVSRIIDDSNDSAIKNSLSECLHSELDQNAFHISFNRKLERAVRNLGGAYFDIVSETQDTSATNMRLKWDFLPSRMDHHLADTLAVRNIHLKALERVVSAI